MQSRIKKTAQFNSILTSLKQALGAEQHLAIAQLARHICKEETKYPVDHVIRTLLTGGYSVAQLLAALLQAESARLKPLFPGHSALPLKVQFEELRRTVHEFNDLQDTIMRLGEEYLDSRQAANLRGAIRLPDNQEARYSEEHADTPEEETFRRAQVIERAIDVWAHSRKVRLFNPFRGLHVTATARLLGRGSDKISISFDPEVARVLASNPEADRAFLLCPGEGWQLAATVLRIEPGKLTLKLGDITPTYIDKRRDVGVQVADKIPVTLVSRGHPACKAQLFDLSISGLGLIIHEEQPNLAQGDEVKCHFQLDGRQIRCSGWIRWLHNVDRITRIGLELKAEKSLQHVLQQEIFRLQRKIITAMHEIEPPERLAAAIIETTEEEA